MDSLPSPAALEMPRFYHELTTATERTRHAQKLASLGREGALQIDAVCDETGGWHAELVTRDWDEPGLLDRIFEAILKCVHIPGGIALRRVRIFTARSGQVVNLLEFADKQGAPLDRGRCDRVLEQLRRIRRGERGALDTISNLTFTTLIPALTEFPHLDNTRSAEYTHLEVRVPRLSNRFTSILVHFLARSEFHVNIQVAEFVQGREGRYSLCVVDKYGQKLGDHPATRRALVLALEAMNHSILRFNLHYIRIGWELRAEKNDGTIYRSRPDPSDYQADLQTIAQLAELQGFAPQLSALVEGGLLDAESFSFLKEFETFCRRNGEVFATLPQRSPTPSDVGLCREFFEQRRRSLRILKPLYRHLLQVEPIPVAREDCTRLVALARPEPTVGFALDGAQQLYPTKALVSPEDMLGLFRLVARTGSELSETAHKAVLVALEAWTPEFIAAQRARLGPAFLHLLAVAISQGTTARVLRTMRQVGLLQRYVPGFARISGLIHLAANHTYTVDEHSLRAIEALDGMLLLRIVLPERGKSPMRRDYEGLTSPIALAVFARKYWVEQQLLRSVLQVRSHPATRPFFRLMDDIRGNSLDYLVDLNLPEQGQAVCLNGLRQTEEIRAALHTLLRLEASLGAAARRDLVLAALLHDIDKPDPNHAHSFAPRVGETLERMGLPLPDTSLQRIARLVRDHLDLGDLMQRMSSEGDAALAEYLAVRGGLPALRELILFTYLDRVAMGLNPNQATHHIMMLTGLLLQAEAMADIGQADTPQPGPGSLDAGPARNGGDSSDPQPAPHPHREAKGDQHGVYREVDP